MGVSSLWARQRIRVLTKCHCHACQWGQRPLTSSLGSVLTLCQVLFEDIFLNGALIPGFYAPIILARTPFNRLKAVWPFLWFVVCLHLWCMQKIQQILWWLPDYVSPQSRLNASPADSLSDSVLAFFLTDCLFESLLQGLLDRLFDFLTSSVMFLKWIIGWIDLCSSCPYGEWYTLSRSHFFLASQTQQSTEPRKSPVGNL